MKFIQSKAGKGKTKKVAELASHYASNGNTVQIISTEHTPQDFNWYAESENLSLNKVSYILIDTFNELIISLVEDSKSDVVFIDGIYGNGKETEAKLNALRSLEITTGKEIYVTRQASYNTSLNEGVSILEFDNQLAI